MQTKFTVALVCVAIADVDTATIDFDWADEDRTGTDFVGVEVRAGGLSALGIGLALLVRT